MHKFIDIPLSPKKSLKAGCHQDERPWKVLSVARKPFEQAYCLKNWLIQCRNVDFLRMLS